MMYPTSVAAFNKFKLNKPRHRTDAEISGNSLVFTRSLNALNSDVRNKLQLVFI